MPEKKPELDEKSLKVEIPTEEEEQEKGEFFYDPSLFIPPTPRAAEGKRSISFVKFDYLLLILIIVFATASVLLTLSGIGFSWDEAYYYKPAQDALHWVFEFLSNPHEASTGKIIDKYWSEISELPAVSKLCLGISQQLFSGLFGQYGVVNGMRVISAVAFAISLALLFLIGFSLGGRIMAIGSVFFYWLMPRVFGHAHIAATETLANCIILLTVWLYLKSVSTQRTGWAILTGIAGGLALATRINCLLIFPVLILIGYLYWREKFAHTFFYLLVVAPITLLVVSPYFWHHTALRVLEYLAFFASHKQQPVYYFGTLYVPGGDAVPWTYPWIMSAITLPLSTLLFVILGVIIAISKSKDGKIALVLGLALFPLIISSLPGTPKYDGVRLFLSAFPFLALLGGLGLAHITRFLVLLLPSAAGLNVKRIATIISALILVLIILNGVLAVVSYRPFYLSFFNQLIGGIKGAYESGLETTYWGEAVNETMITHINDTLPPDARLKLLALHEKVFEYLQQWHILRPDIIIDAPPPYDYHLLLIRKGFFARPERYLFAHWKPEKVISIKGVPLVALYKTGAQFETEWRKMPAHAQ
ncbi:glycosyltransferase family 39 protein [Candidatus Sumerlaeota bacterium]|nr:glycosyltransferase family 39 protein [Candidatus Sumerlaeota bacterium]